MVEYGPILRILHVEFVCLMHKKCIRYVSMVEIWPNTAYKTCGRVNGLMYKSVQAMYQWLNISQLPRIRHVQGECLMYKSV